MNKRIFDLAILFIAHVLFFPIWIALWIVVPLIIWLDMGRPIFYLHKRTGLNGVFFNAIKFRTMVVKADKIGPAWTIDKDNRITRIGKLLRSTAIDELPQVVNILKGDMSFVGPRPIGVEEQKLLEKEIPGFEKRLSALPGLTSPAEVYDPTDDPKLLFYYDLEYIKRANIFLDIKLIILSIKNSILRRWDKRSGKIFQEKAKNR